MSIDCLLLAWLSGLKIGFYEIGDLRSCENPKSVYSRLERFFIRRLKGVIITSKFFYSDYFENYLELVERVQDLGAGEIVINSIDNDGLMKGYDLDLIEKIKNRLNIPMTALGGVGTIEDIGKAIDKFGIIGCAAGSLFVFKGKYKAVLINYPNQEIKKQIINNK